MVAREGGGALVAREEGDALVAREGIVAVARERTTPLGWCLCLARDQTRRSRTRSAPF